MRSIIITDNEDTIVGLRLAGIEGKLVNNESKVIPIVDGLINDGNIGIIMITQDLFHKNYDALLERKLKEKELMIIEIPSFKEEMKKSLITEHIRNSVGLKLE